MFHIRNKYVAGLLSVVVLAFSGGIAVDASSAPTPAAVVACKNATIGGKRKCIAAGQFCARRYERDYNKYGYTCSKKDKNGRYHLKKK